MKGRFARNVRWLRQRSGLPLKRVASDFGKCVPTVSNWERGEFMCNTVGELMMIARYYGVTETELLHSDMRMGQ
jgi:transcriptional regulator with XRE-family HTH domain